MTTVWIVAWMQTGFMRKESFLVFDNYEEALKCYQDYKETCDEVRLIDTEVYHKYM